MRISWSGPVRSRPDLRPGGISSSRMCTINRAAEASMGAAPSVCANFDVVVVGAGNAGLCAALAARESGVSVLVLECAPQSERGGNSRFTAGAMRVAYSGVDDLAGLMPDLTDEDKAPTDFGAYTEDQFFDDLARVTQYRTSPGLAELLVRRSFQTMMWMRTKGVRFQ